MALRLRRGTDAERQLITPVEGELIYATDTKTLFVGDGVTQGGVKVTGAFPESIDDLDDVDISSFSPEAGQILKWNGVNFVPDDLIGLGEQINADIIADDSTILVDSQLQNFQGNTFAGQDFIGDTFTGAFIGDGSQLTNLPVPEGSTGVIEGSNYRINITADDSTIMVNTETQTFTGDFIGDGSGLTNLNLFNNTIFDLGDVFSFTPPDAGDVLQYDGFNFVPQKIQQIEGADSTIIVDADTNTFTGNFVGTFDGDIKGSVFADDSSVIIDGQSRSIISSELTTNRLIPLTENTLELTSLESSNTERQTFKISTNNDRSILRLNKESDDDLTGSTEPYGGVYFEKNDINGSATNSIILGGENYILFSVSDNGEFTSSSQTLFWVDGKLGIGTNPGESLDVVGNGTFTGTVNAASFNGSLVSDDSTTIVDTINSTITAGGFIQFGSYTDDEISEVTPTNGMVYYNSTVNRFRGYQNGVWINLDDGSSV